LTHSVELFAISANRLQPQDSYINGHHFIPHCVYTGEMATVCRCEDGHSFFNCTTDDNQGPIKICRTTGTGSCSSDGFLVSRRKKRDAEEPEAEDDDVILPDDFPIPPYPNSTESSPPPTWPTPSGITEQQASDACQRVLKSYAAFNICQEYVDLEPLVTLCVLNIQVRRTHTLQFKTSVEKRKNLCYHVLRKNAFKVLPIKINIDLLCRSLIIDHVMLVCFSLCVDVH